VAAPPLGRLAGDLFATVLLFHAAPQARAVGPDALRGELLAALDAFTRTAAAHGYRPDQVEEARFALVAWMDEMVQRTAWEGRDQWYRQLLQLQLFNTNRAGNEFFDHLARLRPEQNDARELYVWCLAFGFEGQYQGHPAELRALLQHHVEMLRAAGRAQSVATGDPVTPAAYELDIRLSGGRARGLRGIVLGWAAVCAIVFAVAFAALQYAAGRVPVPGS
jgi:type IV/VI secretion system ImpK/VasF family protein